MISADKFDSVTVVLWATFKGMVGAIDLTVIVISGDTECGIGFVGAVLGLAGRATWTHRGWFSLFDVGCDRVCQCKQKKKMRRLISFTIHVGLSCHSLIAVIDVHGRTVHFPLLSAVSKSHGAIHNKRHLV